MPESAKEQVRSYCEWMKIGEDHVKKETSKMAMDIKKRDEQHKEQERFTREREEQERRNRETTNNDAYLASIASLSLISGIF